MTNLNPSQLLLMRPTNYEFGMADYLAYEEVRNYFLQTNPRAARAALLAGGILWRLAIETVEKGLVLDGPDTLNAALGITFALRDNADNVFIDDHLTTEESHFIVGTYVRLPLHRHNLAGMGYPMWWPHNDHFNDSSLDFGWWSPVAEKWYCDLRAQYRGGHLQPKTGSAWRNSLRNWNKRACRFTDNSKEAASKFLRGVST